MHIHSLITQKCDFDVDGAAKSEDGHKVAGQEEALHYIAETKSCLLVFQISTKDEY